MHPAKNNRGFIFQVCLQGLCQAHIFSIARLQKKRKNPGIQQQYWQCWAVPNNELSQLSLSLFYFCPWLWKSKVEQMRRFFPLHFNLYTFPRNREFWSFPCTPALLNMETELLNTRCQLGLWEQHYQALLAHEKWLGALGEAVWMRATDFNRRGIGAFCYEHFFRGKLTTYYKSGYERHKLVLFLPRAALIMSLSLFKSGFHYGAFLFPHCLWGFASTKVGLGCKPCRESSNPSKKM